MSASSWFYYKKKDPISYDFSSVSTHGFYSYVQVWSYNYEIFSLICHQLARCINTRQLLVMYKVAFNSEYIFSRWLNQEWKLFHTVHHNLNTSPLKKRKKNWCCVTCQKTAWYSCLDWTSLSPPIFTIIFTVSYLNSPHIGRYGTQDSSLKAH
jgi:hypothetical protein